MLRAIIEQKKEGDELKNRIKELRKSTNLTQQEFADKINIARSNIACYESGKNMPSDAVIALICKEFNVNGNWLRTGEGDMFIEIPEEDLYSRAAASLLREDDVLGIEGLKLYYSLSSESRKSVKEYVLSLAEMIKEHENNE